MGCCNGCGVKLISSEVDGSKDTLLDSCNSNQHQTICNKLRSKLPITEYVVQKLDSKISEKYFWDVEDFICDQNMLS